MQTIPARWFHTGRLKPIRLIVIHCTVTNENPTGAEAVARAFARGDRKASAHRVVDSDSIVQCVKDSDTAFAAAGANSDGLHLELVGLPDQTVAQWTDPFSTAMLTRAGPTIREWATENTIPYQWLTIPEVADGTTRGFCTHHDVSRAFPNVSTGHWDPGPNFPKTYAMGVWHPITPPPPTPPPGDDMFSYHTASGTTVIVASGKQVEVTGDVLENTVRSKPTHIGIVGSDDAARFAKAFGDVIRG